MVPDPDAWDPWSPAEMAGRLDGLDVPWCVAGGWALELFFQDRGDRGRGDRGREGDGGPSREHHDLEIAVPADHFGNVAARFAEFDFHVPRDGRLLPASAEALAAGHQTWAAERATGRWRFDVFREPHDGDTWICRRDPGIRRPYTEVVRIGAAGIPYLAPEIVLLFKAKGPRPKDEFDYRNTAPLLDAQERAWLAAALQRRHPWA